MYNKTLEGQLREMSRNFVSNMKVIRSANSLNLSDMAKATKLSRKTISRIEHARVSRGSSYEPRLSTVAKVANAAGCGIEDLLDGRL